MSTRPQIARGLLALALAVALAGPSAAGGPDPRVRDVELRTDAALGRGVELRSLLAFAPGARLTEAAVRRTLSNLHATGRVAEAEILARPALPPEEAPDDPERRNAGDRWVTAVVVARGHVRVAAVEIAGEPGLGRSLVRRALEQKPGTILSEERLLRGHYALQDLYAERGYREASVRLEVEPLEPAAQLARVTYRLESGPRATVATIEFAGDRGSLGDEELRQALKTRVGAHYGRERVEADRERLRAFVAGRGYPTATVEPVLEVYDPLKNRIHLTPLDGALGKQKQTE